MLVKMQQDVQGKKITFLTVRLGKVIPTEPRFIIDSLKILIGSIKNNVEFYNLVEDTIGGSLNLFGSDPNQFLFNKKTLELEVLEIALVGGFAPSVNFEFWGNKKVQIGNLALNTENFENNITWKGINSYDATTDVFITYLSAFDTQSKDVLRLQIARNFELLFVEHLLIGWRVESFSDYITLGYATPKIALDSLVKQTKKRFLARFLMLIWYINDENSDVIPFEDEHVYSECKSMYLEMIESLHLGDSGIFALKAEVERLLFDHAKYKENNKIT